MSSSTILRSVLNRWYITIPGVLLSLVIASTVFSSVPRKYTSSGIAIVVKPKYTTAANFNNPVLGSDGTLTLTTLMLVQALDTPTAKAQLGLTEGGADDFKINNVVTGDVASGGDHPFLYIKTQSSNPRRSVEMVGDVIAAARQKLTELQNDHNVRGQNQVTVDTVVDAAPPKVVMNIVLAVTGAVLMLCIIVTSIAAWGWDTIVVAGQKRHVHRSTSRTKDHTTRESVQAT